MEERKSLLAQLKDTIEFFSKRKTLGRMKTEHSIFIPSQLMLNQAKDTEEFIKAARDINQTIEWNCQVSVVQVKSGKYPGVEFVFAFNPDTKFDSIIVELETRLRE